MGFGFSFRLGGMFAAACIFLPMAANAQQPVKIVMALPAETLTFSAPFLAQDAGFYKDEGLEVTHPVLVGVASVNAVINGSADFTLGTGPVFLRAASKGQRLLAIANLQDRPMVELVMRKDVYAAMKIDDTATLAQRGAALKDKTIAIQGVGTIIHAWVRLIAARGGLDPENDVRIAPMDPPAMMPALLTKAVDGFATSLPYTTDAVLSGEAVMYASAPQGAAPDILPFAGLLVETKPETCKNDPDKCARVVRALVRAVAFIRDKPDEALNILRNRFKAMKPETLDAAWRVVSQAHAADPRVTPEALRNSDKVSIEAKLLAPSDAVGSYDGLYTDAFVPPAH